MSSRRRKATDDHIFDAAHRAMEQYGPREITLAHIAAEAGVTAGLLVQRFGSKRELLLTLASRWAASAPAMFGHLREIHRKPLATLRGYAACMAGLAPTPDALSRNLAYLQVDLTDEDFRVHLLSNAKQTQKELESLVRAAVRAGELSQDVSPRRLARVIETAIGGSLMSWAYYREGKAAAWIRRDLDAVLEPYLARREAAAKGKLRGAF